MKRRLFLFIFFIACILGGFNYTNHSGEKSTPLPPPLQVKAHRILLIPLDSRPPCQQFVINAGRIANIEVITPPSEMLDYYTKAGDCTAIQQWLSANIQSSDAVILSLDQILYGGLLSSREKDGNAAKETKALQFLTELHQKNPLIPIYAFNILPRIHPPASIDQYQQQKDLIKYSRLREEFAIFDNSLDLKELRQLEKDLPDALLQKYQQIYKNNTVLNEKLSKMTKQGIFKKLIIGQDDSEDFGIPNMEKQQIERYLQAENISSDQVFLTRGADEVALSLLSDLQTDFFSPAQPKVYIEYNDSNTPGIIMPYMPGSVATTIREKLRLAHAITVDRPDKADFVLFVHVGNDTNANMNPHSVDRLQELLLQGNKIALIDLSQHFLAKETLFPHLIKNDFPINRLIAYAGWNTTSNSVGTALTQAILFTSQFQSSNAESSRLLLYQNNLTFLNNRFMEDYFYLKDLIDSVNDNLKKAGYTNVYDLDMDHNYKWANDMLQTGLNKRADYLKHTKAFRQPIPVETQNGIQLLRIKDLLVEAAYPWPRTFEIDLKTDLLIQSLQP